MAVAPWASRRRDACLSLQVLAAFSAGALSHGLAPDTRPATVADCRRSWTVPVPSASTLDLAPRAVALHRLSLGDARIWTVAQEHGIAEMLSGDGPTGAVIGGVRYRAPFHDARTGSPAARPRPHSPSRAIAASRMARTSPS
jgi:hypothetical protein